ncbi:hypothetical protein [Paraburkholderia sp. MM5482-R1]|uniref:hypothetical protein n=1 Tax=unclassified Paraburkholderia TaxID=2615204 RepID=UPI003D1B4855
MGDDARCVVWRPRGPAKAGRVDSGFAIEGSCVQTLCEVLKQLVGIPLNRIDLNVFEKEPNRSRYLPHPLQTPVMTAMQKIVDERFENPRRGEYRGNFGVDTGFVREDLCSDADEHRSIEKSEYPTLGLSHYVEGYDFRRPMIDSLMNQ